MKITKTSFATTKISFSSMIDLNNKLICIQSSKNIISIKPCIPLITDCNQWVEIYYEYDLN